MGDHAFGWGASMLGDTLVLNPPRSEGPGIRLYTETSFRLEPPRFVVAIPPAAIPPLPLDRVERFLEISKRSPGLSRRTRRRRRGERASILKELAR